MSMCPFCGKVYDESEYAGCPRCRGKVNKQKANNLKKLKSVKSIQKNNVFK